MLHCSLASYPDKTNPLESNLRQELMWSVLDMFRSCTLNVPQRSKGILKKMFSLGENFWVNGPITLICSSLPSGLNQHLVRMFGSRSLPSNSTLSSPGHPCSKFTAVVIIGNSFTFTRAALLIPLSILVLGLGYQQRQQRHSMTSHSNIFTYHTAAIELVWSFGSGLFFGGFSAGYQEIAVMGYFLAALSLFGENLFHLLTCVERYLAVVYPIIYRGFKGARGVRIRNVSAACVWLLSFVWSSFKTTNEDPTADISLFLFPLLLSLVGASFCSLSVLCALMRPGPGDRERGKEQVKQSKRKAFLTIAAITGVQWFWFLGSVVDTALDTSPLILPSVSCVMGATALWFNLPSSLVLPLLYLYKAGKPPCCF